MNKKELENRTKIFAHNCVKIALSLPESPLGRHVRGQLIRCSTSVAANYRAANLAHSKAAFAAKLSIVIEEVDESDFWLEFAMDENLLSLNSTSIISKEAIELTSIFIASRKSIQTSINNN